MKRYTIRPTEQMQKMSRLMCIPFTLVSGAFAAIGVTTIIPSGAGLFGFVWTGMAVVFCGFGIYGLVNKRGLYFARNYGMEIESETDEAPPSPPTQSRLEELQGLYDQSLITQAEYEEKRAEILKDL